MADLYLRKYPATDIFDAWQNLMGIEVRFFDLETSQAKTLFSMTFWDNFLAHQKKVPMLKPSLKLLYPKGLCSTSETGPDFSTVGNVEKNGAMAGRAM